MVIFEPLQSKVLILPIDAEEKTPGGIIIPENAKEKPKIATVVSVPLNFDGTVKVGDKVVFSQYAGTEFILDEVSHLIIEENDIMGILHEDSNTD